MNALKKSILMEDLLNRIIEAKKEALDGITRVKEIPRILRDNALRIAALRKELTFIHAQIAVAQESPVEREKNICLALEKMLAYRKSQRAILQNLCKALGISIDDFQPEKIHLSQLVAILNDASMNPDINFDDSFTL